MSSYTQKGSNQLHAKIDSDLERISTAARPYCSAIILLGGYGRGEGTPFILEDGSQAPFNDYDLVVVVDAVNNTVKCRFQELEKQLTECIGLPVDLYPYAFSKLSSCEFSLLNYEMKYGHKVVWGEKEILNAMPNYDHTSIPLSEGSRLLLNRGKLLLDMQQRFKKPEPLSPNERIRFIKFIHKVLLAFGDCALLEAGQFDILYGTKKKRIFDIGPCPNRNQMIEGFLQAVALKEWADYAPFSDVNLVLEFERVKRLYLSFFAWYQEQYSLRECSIPKAIALNLIWNKSVCTHHPRIKLYHSICELLRDDSSQSLNRFYQLQRRFS